MSVEHKRPLLAFIIVAVICGMVIGHALATQALPSTMWTRPIAVVEGIVFAPAAAAQPEVTAPARASAASAGVVAPATAATRSTTASTTVSTSVSGVSTQTQPAKAGKRPAAHHGKSTLRHQKVVPGRKFGRASVSARHSSWAGAFGGTRVHHGNSHTKPCGCDRERWSAVALFRSR